MLILYRILTFILYYTALPFIYSAILFGSEKWKQRLGYIPSFETAEGCIKIWLHASSMGELKVLAILKEQIEKTNDNICIYITVMTETGYRAASALGSEKGTVAYFPLDYILSARRFLNTVKPHAAVFIETEIWPSMIYELTKWDIPIFLANGRLSEKSFRRYRLFKKSLRRLFRGYCRLMVQTETDLERYIGIGAGKDRITVTGSLKFDAPVTILPDNRKAELRNSLPFQNGVRIFICGSTRREENEIILRIFKRLSEKRPDVRLILVPRHLDRIDEIKKLARREGVNYRLYSDIASPNDDIPLLIVDRMGILNDLYSISNIAFVGGTLVDIGGHNILEPVWAGIPVFYGPSIYSVEDSSAYIIENQFGAVVDDENDLYDKLLAYLKGEIIFHKKRDDDAGESHASRTARIILDYLITDGTNLEENNQ